MSVPEGKWKTFGTCFGIGGCYSNLSFLNVRESCFCLQMISLRLRSFSMHYEVSLESQLMEDLPSPWEKLFKVVQVWRDLMEAPLYGELAWKINNNKLLLKKLDFENQINKTWLVVLHQIMSVIVSKLAVCNLWENNNNSKQIVILTGEKRRLPFLESMIERAQNGDGLTDQEIKNQVNTIMFEVSTSRFAPSPTSPRRADAILTNLEIKFPLKIHILI